MQKQVKWNLIVTILLVFIATTISISSVVFIVGGCMNPWILPLSFLTATVIVYGLMKKKYDNKTFLINTGISLILFLVLTSLATAFYDSSWDGNVYHKQMIGLMKNGMNPLYNVTSGDIWSQHYANGTEIWAAAIYSSFGNIEAGKVIHFLLAFILYVYLYRYLKEKTKKKLIPCLFSLALAFNPIMINQFTTYYIDGVVANSLFLVLLSIIKIIDNGYHFKSKDTYLIFASSAIICVNAKFTALLICGMFVGLFGLFIMIQNIMQKNYQYLRRVILFVIVTFIFSVGVVGSSSYVKNYLQNGNPFYPLMGEGAVDIETGNEPDLFKKFNHVEKFLYATFSKTYTWYNKDPELKVPFTVSASELDSIQYPDIRIGGLGVWYSGMLILSIPVILVGLVDLIRRRSKWAIVILIALFGILAPIPILPVVWQARYYPQIYLIPFIAMLMLMFYKKKIAKIYNYLLILSAIGNSLFLLPQAVNKWENSIYINRSLVDIAEKSLTEKVVISQDNYTFYGAYYNYLDKGIHYEYSKEILEDGIPMYYGARYQIIEE